MEFIEMAKKNATVKNHKNRKNAGNVTHNNAAAHSNAAHNNAASMGGKRKDKRKTKKRTLSNGAKSWKDSVMSVHTELKKKNPNATLMMAMKEASKRKKKGQL